MPVYRAASARAGTKRTATAAAASTTRLTHAKLVERSDEDLAIARPVELAKEDALPLSECELALAQRNEDLRARQRRPNMRRRIRPVGIFDVLPVPAVVADPLHGV